tara:strand:+ start:285 stop:626 length:342 start_codon:yes stop_codon:yes gene_type:complete
MAFASGKYALAICDRCGFQYKYTSLKKEWTGFRVCSECFEVKHPQLEPISHIADAEALQYPRPAQSAADVAGSGVVRTIDANQMMSTTGDPIGSEFNQSAATGEIGTITVVIT